ncbi:MAG: hypothetical protein WC869_10415 [Phycisphaerae bacterium]|jgi:hypothetical protein
MMKLSDLEVVEYQLDEDTLSGVDVRLVNRRNMPGRPDRWAIVEGGNCYNWEGEWEYEPMLGSRDDEFFQRCRYASPQQALDHWVKSGGKSFRRRCAEKRAARSGEEE